MMKKISVIFILLFLIVASTNAQVWKRNRVEVFGGFPVTHYFGDIGGSADKNNLLGLKDISYKALRPGLSFGAIYRATHRVYVQGGFNFGFLGQTDAGSINSSRNYGFSTLESEVSFTGMYYLIPESEQNYYYSVMQLRGGLSHINRPLSVYVFAGGSGIFYNVSPRKDLVESDRFNGSHSFTWAIPVGGGIKYQILPRVLLGAELSARYLFTDYIDGFSPAASKYKDVYYVLNFKIYYRFPYNNILKSLNWKF